MTDDELVPILDDDEQLVGYALEASDGAVIGIGLDGTIVSAVDPQTGELLDESEYTFADDGDEGELEPGDYDDEQLAEYAQRLDVLEQRAAEPVVPFSYERVNDEIDEGRLTNDLAQQADHLERLLDRPLTLAERRRVATEAFSDLDSGDLRPDLLAAAARLGDVGEPLRDLDDPHRGRAHEARTAHMAERLSDQDRYAASERGEDDLANPIRPPSRESFDMDDRQQRAAFMAERLEGRAESDQAYSSSDYDAEGDDSDA